jgi:GPI inositol-deacylase
MRPATRSTAQSHRDHNSSSSNSNSNSQVSEYASSPPEGLIDYDGRDTVRLQRFEPTQHNSKSGSSLYYPTGPTRIQQSINTDLSGRIRPSLRPLDDDGMAVEETASLLPKSPNKPNLRDGRVRIRPRGCSLVSFILAAISIAFLGLVAHSFLNLQRDPKGCKMSFMYPSYAKLSDFDTEHTRFATKYSLYLYREQKMDLSLEVDHFDRLVLLIIADWGARTIHSWKCR